MGRPPAGWDPRRMPSLPQLTDVLKGSVLTPDHPDYDRARTVAVGAVDRRPALIVRVADAADVAVVIELARDTGLELAVRGGGHSMAGHGVTDGGIVLDLSDMKRLEIDLDARTAWAETGLTVDEYSTAAGRHGLATGFGDAGSVGIGGITLGGGVGYLVRKHGLTVDSLLAAEVVTADGELLRVDDESHPDLFWAIRGGGGNFGVATRLQFRLHDVDTIVGGMLLLPATADVIASFVAAAEAAPEELSTIANVMPAPPLPFVAPQHHGRLVVLAMLAYAGDVEDGRRALEPFRALATPIADMVRPMSYPEIFPPEPGGGAPAAAMRTSFVDRFDRSAAEVLVDRLQDPSVGMAVSQLRVLGGAMARVPAGATAFAHRGRRMMVNVVTMYERPEERLPREVWVADLAADLGGGGAAYVGFLGDEGEARVRAAYPGATWDRLAAVKARYDRDNLFRLNQNVPPAMEELDAAA
jgi:FAD/FMN-containing dehydrogenase